MDEQLVTKEWLDSYCNAPKLLLQARRGTIPQVLDSSATEINQTRLAPS
jgi:hypothetical protein